MRLRREKKKSGFSHLWPHDDVTIGEKTSFFSFFFLKSYNSSFSESLNFNHLEQCNVLRRTFW